MRGDLQLHWKENFRNPNEKAFAQQSNTWTFGRCGTTEFLHATTTSEYCCGGVLPLPSHILRTPSEKEAVYLEESTDDKELILHSPIQWTRTLTQIQSLPALDTGHDAIYVVDMKRAQEEIN